MQVQKENIRKIILGVARDEFLEKGFKGVSMRLIASKSQVGLSNIYNYFKNKDEIYREVLGPLLNTLKKMMEEHNREDYLTMDVFHSEEYLYLYLNIYLNLIETYSGELKLLLFYSHGSSLENYKDEYINLNTQVGMDYLHKMKKKYPEINADISDFFIHTMTSSWLNLIGEIVTHNLSHKEIKQFLSEYISFITAGWKKIMGV